MDFDLSREWLESNGIGGYACGTIINCNTRRYHALLCAATQPPLGRMVLVNKADETLVVKTPDGLRHFELGCNQYPGAVHPTGYQFLDSFEPSPLPRWIYAIPRALSGLDFDIRLEKTLWMPHGRNATVVRYQLLEGDGVTLNVHPFVTGRDYHNTMRSNSFLNGHIEREDDESGGHHVTLHPYDSCPPIVFSHDGEFYEGGAWYYDFQYAMEAERGLDSIEDAYCPGAFVFHLAQGATATFVVRMGGELSVTSAMKKSNEGTQATEIARRRELGAVFAKMPEPDRSYAQRLAKAADQFLVRRGDNLHTVLAGYPWFTDWGRDTMIALPGLCLTTERFYEAASILLSFAKAASQGMIPNRFPDAGETPDYNTVDATLWFFHATAQYYERSSDSKTVSEALYPVLKECIEWHLKGTRYGIKADESDGLLRAGESGTQLTWMDAKVSDWVVTPREGKPVEIQALWFNALCTMSGFATRLGDTQTAALCDEWSAKIKANFRTLFWNESEQCLYDVINGEHRDGALRPNQLFVVSLPHRLLEREDEAKIVAVCERDLLTPHGMRSLSPRDSRYCGTYIGDQWQRDGAYHQGTVWGWLIGPFLSAYVKVHDHSDASKMQARLWLQPLLEHLDAACLDSISEVFDGDAPYTPRGCFAQAWSVSEVLRVLVEEL